MNWLDSKGGKILTKPGIFLLSIAIGFILGLGVR